MMPPKLWAMNIIGLSSASSRLDASLFSRFTACSLTPAIEVSKATLELYPNKRIRALGNWEGKKSLNHNLFPMVQVASAWNSVFVGFRPWTATILVRIMRSAWDPTERGRESFNLLDARALRVYESPKEVPRHRGGCL